jgi:hypothetical protein
MPKRDIPSKWLQPTNYVVKRFETSQGLVERYLGKVRLKKPTPKR